jgi:hypothetical protein
MSGDERNGLEKMYPSQKQRVEFLYYMVRDAEREAHEIDPDQTLKDQLERARLSLADALSAVRHMMKYQGENV